MYNDIDTKKILKEAYIDSMQAVGFDVVTTLTFKRGISVADAKSAVEWLWRRLDDKAYGSKKVGHLLRNGIKLGLGRVYVLDRGATNWHWHAVIKLGGRFERSEQLVEAIGAIWQGMDKAGDFGQLEAIDKDRERGCYAYLAEKIVWGGNDWEHDNVKLTARES